MCIRDSLCKMMSEEVGNVQKPRQVDLQANRSVEKRLNISTCVRQLLGGIETIDVILKKRLVSEEQANGAVQFGEFSARHAVSAAVC